MAKKKVVLDERNLVIDTIYGLGTYENPPPAIGKAIIKALLDFGAKGHVALDIYQSKNVRWFFDGLDNARGRGPKSAASAYRLFTAYLKDDSNCVGTNIAAMNAGRTPCGWGGVTTAAEFKKQMGAK